MTSLSPNWRLPRDWQQTVDNIVALYETIVEALQNPLDNPEQTLVAVLALVVAGLLISAVLTAVASPRNRRSSADNGASNESQDSGPS